DDLAPIFKSRSHAGWRDRGVAHVVATLHEARSCLPEIGGHADGEFATVARRCRIENVQVAGLLVDELPGSRAHVENGEVLVRGEAANLLRARVVRVDVELAVAIGAEVDGVADPLRVDVVRATFGLRNLFDRMRRDVV